MPENETLQDLGLDEYKYHFVDEEKHVFRTQRGLTEDVVRQISAQKNEPEWMLEFRLKALEIYYSKPMPTWGGDLSDLETGPGRHLLLRPAAGQDGALLGRCPGEHQDDLRTVGDPRGGAEDPGRGRRPVRVGDGLPLPEEGVGGPGCHLRFHRGGPQEPP